MTLRSPTPPLPPPSCPTPFTSLHFISEPDPGVFSPSQVTASFWQSWKEFEIRHGNEDTIREMLRIKRSVQATYNTQVNFMSSQMMKATTSSTGTGESSLHADVTAAATALVFGVRASVSVLPRFVSRSHPLCPKCQTSLRASWAWTT